MLSVQAKKCNVVESLFRASTHKKISFRSSIQNLKFYKILKFNILLIYLKKVKNYLTFKFIPDYYSRE